MKIKKIAVLILAIITGLTGACQPNSSAQTLPPIRIEYTNWWGDHTMIIAEEKGLFDKRNANVEGIYYEEYPPAIPDMASGVLDGMLISIGDAIQMAQESRVVVVAAYDNGGSIVIAATPDINSVQDLKGKSIGVSIGSAYELFVIEMLKSGGLTRNDVTFVDLSDADIPAQLGKTIQAGLTWEPFLSEALAAGNKELYRSNEVSSLYPNVILFQETTLQRQPNNVRAFLAAWFEAVKFRQTNPDESREIIAKKLGIPVEDVVGDARLMSLEDNRLLFADLNAQTTGSISYIAQLHTGFLITLGTIKAESDFESLFDPSYLQE